MKIIDVAKISHEINRAYCKSIGDTSQPSWEEAPKWQRESAVNGVRAHLDNKNLTIEESHKNWMNIKLKDGWKYGENKCTDKKEHPCLLPYDQLPIEHRTKNALFKQIVNLLDEHLEN